MTPQEWAGQWSRLDQFRVKDESRRDAMGAEWFAQLRHWHVDAVDEGITRLIGAAQDNFLPGLGLLKDFIQQRIDRYNRSPGKCPTCDGSTWIEAQPWKSNGIIYEGLQRCPDCGVPAPQTHERKTYQGLTPVEFHEYQARRYGRELMPEGLQAKHPERPGNPELRRLVAAFRAKFANSYEDLA
jgi:hypothetical protein